MNTSKRVYKIAAVVAFFILFGFGFSLGENLLFPPHRINWHGAFWHGLSIAALGLFLGWFGNQLQKFFKDQVK